MAASVSLLVDGAVRSAAVDDPDMPLLYFLRDQLGLNNPRFGCGLGQCGACTVHIDGEPVRSCITPLSTLAKANVTTLAGLGGRDNPHPLQSAWIEEEASQCGFCLNGFVMTGVALLRKTPKPSEEEIRFALKDLKCRCGTHLAAIRAIRRASEQMTGGSNG